MKPILLALFAALASPALAQSTISHREIVVWPEEMNQRTPRPADTSALEAALVTSVLEANNRERARMGIGPLTHDALLAESAARYSRKMRDQGFFDHVAPDGESLAQRLPAGTLSRYHALGENLWWAEGALDWQASAIADMVASHWLDSPTHRDNLLDPVYTHGGVGIAVVGEKVYVTMLYARPHGGAVSG